MRYWMLSVSLAMLLATPLLVADWTPDIEAWNSPQPERPAAVIIRNATIWTGTDAGVIEQADLLIVNGRISAVGPDLSAPRGASEVDGTDRHITPGIIDAHSHAAMSGGVNEMSRISTADVRVRDVIDSESINIYRQLAGGVTTINLLHGSANAIGGQMAVIKMRWGASPAELVFDAAPEGIKFALGENPKQSNWDVSEPRYPQTRHGVEQIIREKFQQAEDHRRAFTDRPRGRAARDRVPPRPNHELDAIAEIIHGERDVHSHAYRADEMLALMRVAEQFDFVIKTFQHVLEGYKIAPQMAAHGAGGSTFIDWWSFKHEAIDAIGFNPALMHESGVLTGLHSDNPELARRMNLEAAKAVRYGDVDPHDALMMITAWPADQLGIGNRTGRLAEGFDADFVIWNGHPLSVYSLAEQTWVDGLRYFDRESDQRMREALEAERAELIALALEADEADENDNGNNNDGDEAPDRKRIHSFAAHLTGYRPSELDHDEYCIFHAH
ncbi:MAG: amidohydrolase family protein [Wenzhouxiangella sp.]